MAVTIKDIANAAGVSYSTVSRALNGISGAKSESHDRIREIAQRMGYIPNQAAIHLKKSRSYVIGLYFSAIGKMTSPFVLHDVLTGVYEVVGSRYNVVVKGIDMHEKGSLNPSYFDGIIVLSQRSEDSGFMSEVMEKKIPMAVICRSVDIDAPNVTTDETKAMERAMDYLLDNGHRRIAVIEGTRGLDSTALRRKGWRRSIKRHGLDADVVPVASGNYRYESGYRAAKELLSSCPTAILCFNDEMAFGARTAITEAGLQVPEDVSLMGFDNWDLSGYYQMRLTTVERNMGEIAREGARILLKRLDEGIVDNRQVYLDTRLVERDTVKRINARA